MDLSSKTDVGCQGGCCGTCNALTKTEKACCPICGSVVFQSFFNPRTQECAVCGFGWDGIGNRQVRVQEHLLTAVREKLHDKAHEETVKVESALEAWMNAPRWPTDY